MSEELKPCPFCGGSATLSDEKPFTVECEGCGVRTAMGQETPDYAIESWNTHPAPAARSAGTVAQEEVDRDCMLRTAAYYPCYANGDNYDEMLQMAASMLPECPLKGLLLSAASNDATLTAELAEAREQRQESARQWRDSFEAMHQRAMAAERQRDSLRDECERLRAWCKAAIRAYGNECYHAAADYVQAGLNGEEIPETLADMSASGREGE